MSQAPAPNPFLLPFVECSGHGACQREPSMCRDGEVCLAVCQCDGEWDGADCSRSAAVMASIVAMRKDHLALQAKSLASADLQSPEAVNQQAQTLATIAKPDELVPESRDMMLNIVDSLVSASQSGETEMETSTGTSLLNVVTGAVFSTINKAQAAASKSSAAASENDKRVLVAHLSQSVQAPAMTRTLAANYPVWDPRRWLGDTAVAPTSTASSSNSTTTTGSVVSAAEADAKNASMKMVNTVSSISTSLMKGAVGGEEPVSISTSSLTLSLQRVSSSSLGSSGVSSDGIALPLMSDGTGDVDIRSVSWSTNPVRWTRSLWRVTWGFAQLSFCFC